MTFIEPLSTAGGFLSNSFSSGGEADDPSTQMDVPITGPPPSVFVESSSSSFSSSSSLSASSSRKFSVEATAHCVDPVLNLVEGARLFAGDSGGGGLTTAAPEASEEGGPSSPRVVGWGDPFYGSAIFVEPGEGLGPHFVDGSWGGEEGEDDSSLSTSLNGWVTFENGEHLVSASDCAPLMVSEREVGEGRMAMGFLLDVKDIREDERRVLFDNGVGFQVGVVGKRDGRMDFGILPSAGEGGKWVAKGNGVMAETCFGFPGFFLIALDKEGGVGIWKQRSRLKAREEFPPETGRDAGGLNLWARLGGLGRLTLGCDGKGENCFPGRLGFFFFQRDIAEDPQALTEEILREEIDWEGTCGNGALDPGEQCDPDMMIVEEEEEELTGKEEETGTEGSGSSGETDTTPPSEFLERKEQAVLLSELRSRKGKRKARQGNLCSCSCRARCPKFEDTLGPSQKGRFLIDGTGQEFRTVLSLRCNELGGSHPDGGPLREDEVVCGTAVPGEWTRTRTSLVCKNGRLGFFFFQRDIAEDPQALTEEILREEIDWEGTCGNGALDPGEQCDPDMMIVEEEEEELTGKEEETGTEGSGSSGETDTTPPSEFLERKEQAVLLSELRSRKGKRKARQGNLCSCSCRARCPKFEDTLGPSQKGRFLIDGTGQEFRTVLSLRCNELGGSHPDGGPLREDEVVCGTAVPGEWTRTRTSLVCKNGRAGGRAGVNSCMGGEGGSWGSTAEKGRASLSQYFCVSLFVCL
uniref:Uncharacterized protein n=1 Tax=Chromera velia CCMP2878 TaxID=1169474 RepID=A0A0G4HTY1_9ALVE|eukprot:Cvel_31590.t1-p1 / transcript=Cvel_31590.t1 / gene=Cvel_31590 / organism=Chromera_velia_CCMP2878 / gene_product=hypothetical protein / transcript_product=hypothetical protein / location=Cvel_scaffold4737:2134-6086(-) / protein_length=750 / sequence_SO=supercontig / SO=protein_coding / is_pseudo=false